MHPLPGGRVGEPQGPSVEKRALPALNLASNPGPRMLTAVVDAVAEERPALLHHVDSDLVSAPRLQLDIVQRQALAARQFAFFSRGKPFTAGISQSMHPTYE